MNSPAYRNLGRTQSGAFLLEALIGILIFSLGVLGIVGLQARAIRFTGLPSHRYDLISSR